MVFEGEANDNFSPGELREQRKNSLLEFGRSVDEVRAWIAQREVETDPLRSPDLSDADRAEVHLVYESLKASAATADVAIDVAEAQIDLQGVFLEARRRTEELRAAFIEAQHHA